MAASPRRGGEELDFSAIGKIADNPIFRGATRIVTWVGVAGISALLGYASNQVSSVKDAQQTMFNRMAVFENKIGSVQSTQIDRASDSERFQTQVLASLEGIKSDVITIKINEASMNTILREHFPNVGERETGVSPAMAMQP